MFGLIKGLWDYYFQKPTIKILMVGLDNAGKTTILNQLKSLAGQNCLPLDKITPTVGLNIARIDMGDNISLFWDLGGQPILRSIWKKYYAECHGIIFVIDITNEERLDESLEALNDILNHKDLNKVPLLVLLNKSEKDDTNMKVEIEFSKKFNPTEIKDRDFFYEKVSALKKCKIVESIKWLNSAVFNHYKQYNNKEA